ENSPAEARAFAALEAVGLAEEADRPASELAGSGRERLMIAAALATNPAVLLVDEPSPGAAPADLELLTTILTRRKAEGSAVLLVEHTRALVHAVAARVLTLELGRVASRDPDARL